MSPRNSHVQPQLRTINLTSITKVLSKDDITQLVISSYLAFSQTSVVGIQCLPKYALKNLTLCSVSSAGAPEIKEDSPPRSHFSA